MIKRGQGHITTAQSIKQVCAELNTEQVAIAEPKTAHLVFNKTGFSIMAICRSGEEAEILAAWLHSKGATSATSSLPPGAVFDGSELYWVGMNVKDLPILEKLGIKVRELPSREQSSTAVLDRMQPMPCAKELE